MTTLSDLITPQTPEQVEASALSVARCAGFPTITQAWQLGTVPRTIIQILAQGVSDLSQTISNIASGAFTDLATGEWLDGLANSIYGLTRYPALATVRQFKLTSSGVGYSWNPGDITVQMSDGSAYVNVNGNTIVSNSAAYLTFQNQTSGSAGNNMLPGTPIVMLTPYAGITVTNPEIIGTSSDIIRPGNDAESDSSLAFRCRARWSTLGSGSNLLAWQYYVLSAGAATVGRYQIVPNYTNGSVSVILAPASGSGAVTVSDLSLVTATLLAKAPLCIQPIVRLADVFTFGFSGSIKISTNFYASAVSQIYTNWSKYAATVPIGGVFEPNKLISAVETVPGVVSCVLYRSGSGTLQLDQTPVQLPAGTLLTLSVPTELVTFTAV